MVESLNDSYEDNFLSEITKEVESEIDFESNKINLDKMVDDENLDQHIQSSYPPKDSFPPALTDDEKVEIDSRSIYVGNVDYGSTAREIEAHFNGCGPINKITILTNKFTGHPKGFAYIEFANIDSVDTAMSLDESVFRERQLKVMPKRTNIPGISTTNRPPRRIRPRGSFGANQYHGMPRTSRYRRNNPSGYAPY